jgi:hypothetical protein
MIHIERLALRPTCSVLHGRKRLAFLRRFVDRIP